VVLCCGFWQHHRIFDNHQKSLWEQHTLHVTVDIRNLMLSGLDLLEQVELAK